MGNVLFRLPELDYLSSAQIIEKFGPPQIGKVSRKDGEPLEKGLPEYLVEPVEFTPEINQDLHEVQLIDFGEGAPSIDFVSHSCG
jgi:hypothetical protein